MRRGIKGPGQNLARDANETVPTAEGNETTAVRFGAATPIDGIRLGDSLYRASSGPSASLNTDAAACTTGITRS